MRQVEEEGFVLRFLDELDGALGEGFGELFLIVRGDGGVHDFGAFDERAGPGRCPFGLGVKGPHVVGVGDAVVVVEAVVGWQEFSWWPRCHLPKQAVA
jgi:hypothetical protein